MVEGAALEMLCGETHLGFESLTLRIKLPADVVCGEFFYGLQWKCNVTSDQSVAIKCKNMQKGEKR